MIAIIDYGCGNLKNVKKAFEFIGHEALITGEKSKIEDASHVVLPGVGAFGDAIKKLRETKLDETIERCVRKGKPFLGICLGMQLMLEKSYEFGEHEGLSLIKGEVKKFQTKLLVPHMGWNNISIKDKSGIIKNEGYYYFVHSYHAEGVPEENIMAECVYDYKFTCAIRKDNVFGVQFHPEKSADAGIDILKRFGEIR